MTNWLKERNEEIYELKNKGATVRELAKQYGISETRVHQIYTRIKDKKTGERYNKIIYSNFYKALEEANRKLDYTERMVKKTYNLLYSSGVLAKICDDGIDFFDIPRRELTRITYYGPKTDELTVLAYKIYRKDYMHDPE